MIVARRSRVMGWPLRWSLAGCATLPRAAVAVVAATAVLGQVGDLRGLGHDA